MFRFPLTSIQKGEKMIMIFLCSMLACNEQETDTASECECTCTGCECECEIE